MATISLSRFKTNIQRDLSQIGAANTVKDYIFKVVNLFTFFKIFCAMTISKVNPKYLLTDEKYTCKFLTPSEMFAFSQQQDLELGEDFLRYAIEKGDECFAILDGNRLAAYGWYSNAPTIVSDELRLKFHKDYIYMYKGFTHYDYRGQRLHAIGMTLALDEYLKQGFKGIVSYVEEHNFRSLQSVYRMGYSDFGKVYILKLLGKYFIRHSSGCGAYGFRVESVPTELNPAREKN